jgi:hypothetical protein
LFPGEADDDVVKLAFDRVGELNVGHRAAGVAHEMVMVTGELLGEFEAGEAAVPSETVDDAGFLEHGEVAVQAALRQMRREDLELLDG